MQFERQGEDFHNSLLQLENSRLQFDNSSPSRQYTDSPQLDSRTLPQPQHFNDQYGKRAFNGHDLLAFYMVILIISKDSKIRCLKLNL